MLIFSIGLVVVLLILGIPIWLCLATGSILIATFSLNLALSGIAQILYTSLDSWALLTVPLFLISGNIMTYGGTTKYLVRFLNNFLGHFPGGMAAITAITSMIFGALCGSSTAAAAGLSSVLLKDMTDLGYKKSFAAATVAAGGTLSAIIPPSGILILYAAITEQSIAALFAAGMLPGIVMGLVILAVGVSISAIRGYKTSSPVTWNDRWRGAMSAIPALSLPVFILGSIYTGIATPTEAAAVACLLAWLLGQFIYRGLKWEQLKVAVSEAMKVTSMIFLIICAAILFSKMLTYSGISEIIVNSVLAGTMTSTTFLMALNLLLLVLGCFMDQAAILFMFAPLVAPIAFSLGIHPVHLGVVWTVNAEIGMLTPPFGLNLFVLCAASKEPVGRISRELVPFIVLMMGVLVIITYFPGLSLMLPRLMGLID